MSLVRERSLQQLDPVDALAARPLALVAAGGAAVYAVVMTWTHVREIGSSALALAALVLVAASVLVIAVGSRPDRAPMRSGTASLALAFVALAAIASAVSTAGSNRFARDDWGAGALALIIVALAPYRPARELAVGGALSAILLGFLGVVAAPSFAATQPASLFVVIEIMPVVVATAAVVPFVSRLVREIERWRSQARRSVFTDDDETWIARTVQQDTVTRLNELIVPFLERVAAAGRVTDADADEARLLAQGVRESVVADMDRAWLSSVVADVVADAGGAPVPADAVVDPVRVGDSLTVDQRSALRAALTALVRHPLCDASTLSVRSSVVAEHRIVDVDVRFDGAETELRRALAPSAAMLHILLPHLSVVFERPRLTVRFTNDR